jgi:hypothetical protein
MERLDFELPDFTRVAWVSDLARETWAPRLERITAAWQEIEWRAVVAGVRRCAIAMTSPEGFVAEAPRWNDAGLVAIPLEMLGVLPQPYSATSVAPEAGKPFVYRFVLGRSADVSAFKRAWDDADQEAIGHLLGYPPCCREFFRRVWVDDAMVDTTWPMAVATTAPSDSEGTVVEVAGPPECNVLWRWTGARAVPHLPCRFDCEATVELASALLAVGRDSGFEAEMDWLLEVLRWPVEWSALHGIAEIKSPVLKVSSRTDATTRRYVVRWEGDRYPAESMEGLGFPFRAPPKLRITGARGFRRGIENVVALRPSWYASDNGFTSIAAMDKAHAPVVAAVAAALRRGGTVVDLGCGNGALLAKVVAEVPGVEPWGVDLDPGRVRHAAELHPEHADQFLAGDLCDPEGTVWAGGRMFDLAIVMPGRLVEAGSRRAEGLREVLRTRCRQRLVYAYADWIQRFGTLGALAGAAGLAIRGPSVQAAALADIVAAAPGALPREEEHRER